jgi:hypothetical protein
MTHYTIFWGHFICLCLVKIWKNLSNLRPLRKEKVQSFLTVCSSGVIIESAFGRGDPGSNPTGETITALLCKLTICMHCLCVLFWATVIEPGLPDGLFYCQKFQFGYILEDIEMKNVGIFSGHLEYFTAIRWWPFGHLVLSFPFWYICGIK